VKYSKSQMNGFSIKYSNVNIGTLTNEGCDLLQTIAEAKNIRITNETDPHHLVKADEDMFRLILRNLLSNAIKFSTEGGEIRITSQRVEDSIIISVKDQGVGLSENEVERLFAKNLHDSKQGTLNERGTGLGLMLCKEFVEKNNGKIWVKSELEKGSTFSFSLPAAEYWRALTA
jgi:two-component system, sensor histidine kinase and response regulator